MRSTLGGQLPAFWLFLCCVSESRLYAVVQIVHMQRVLPQQCVAAPLVLKRLNLAFEEPTLDTTVFRSKPSGRAELPQLSLIKDGQKTPRGARKTLLEARAARLYSQGVRRQSVIPPTWNPPVEECSLHKFTMYFNMHSRNREVNNYIGKSALTPSRPLPSS